MSAETVAIPQLIEQIAQLAANGKTAEIRASSVRDAYLLGYQDGTIAEMIARANVGADDEPPEPEPSGYAYRYNDGVVRFNGGSAINGAPPIEVLPYWLAPPAAAPRPEPGPFEHFENWMVREMPPMTVVANPKWWAKRIYERVINTAPAAAAPRPEPGPDAAPEGGQ
jgi:hypothetical protein